MAQPVTSDELRGREPPPQLDPNVKIPKAVLDAGTRAEAIQKAVIGEAEPSIVAPTPPDPNAPPPEAPPSPPTPEQQAQPPVMPQPQAPQQQAPPPEPQDWERNFHRLKGRYDKLYTDMQQMTEQNSRLKNENASLRSVAPPTNGHAPQGQVVNLLSEQEITDYGPEFIDVVRRAAAEVAGPLQAEIETLRGQLGHVQAETSNAFLTRMNATIGGLVPNWNDLNADPRFIHWVNLPDVYSGVIRQELMQQAWNQGEAHRVAAFFRAFLAEEAAVDPQGGRGQPQMMAPPAPIPAPSYVPPINPGQVPLQTRLSLDQLAAPGRAHSAAQQPADKPFYTAQDITKFYTDVAAGKWRSREAERAAIDADIISAQHEGRIIPDQRTARPQNTFGGGR